MLKSNTSLNKSEDIPKPQEEKRPNGSKSSANHNVKNALSKSNNSILQEAIDLVEDYFGKYYDEYGTLHNIKRFTWRNKNKIQVQVINYGARIVSIKMPDRKGAVHDIVLGFDDMAGYIHHKDKFFGATIGRMTGMVTNSTFVINQKQHWLTPNCCPHHHNGGRKGLDQAIWTTYVDDKKVLMSYVSPHMSEGYPGDLLIRIMFELSPRNEFSIKMEAQCTEPTIVNLSNLVYFNLGTHYGGPQELYKHMLTMNCNCFTPSVDNTPSGVIMNVVHSDFDFQVPKILGKVMGIFPGDGFDQNLCVNRGMNQEDCFVARILHPPSGRMLEVYSNQPGVQLKTANNFGYNEILSMEQLVKGPPVSAVTIRKCHGSEPLLRLYTKIHKEIREPLLQDEGNTYKGLYDLIKKIKDLDVLDVHVSEGEPEDKAVKESKFFSKHRDLVPCDFVFSELQVTYLNSLLKVLCDSCDEDPCDELKEIVKLILDLVKITDLEKEVEELNVEEAVQESNEETKTEEAKEAIIQEKTKKSVSSVSNDKGKKKNIKRNVIPEYYLNTKKILGKDRAHYRTHGGIAIQTQNYPGCANFKNFPNCVLKPGESYTHNITYKFWIRAGNPNKWIKRNVKET